MRLINTVMWYYQQQQFSEDQVNKHVGFVYMITQISTGKKYIGKKILKNKLAKKPLKGKTKRRISYVDSDWQSYYGSNETLKLLIESSSPSDFKREILHLCRTKTEMSYLETKEIIVRDAILRDDYFNDWFSAKITRKHAHSIREGLISREVGR